MSETISRGDRWKNKKTKRIAVVIVAYNQSNFISYRSAHGDGSDDAYADLADEQRLDESQVGYRYETRAGRTAMTTWLKRKAFLKAFERAPTKGK